MIQRRQVLTRRCASQRERDLRLGMVFPPFFRDEGGLFPRRSPPALFFALRILSIVSPSSAGFSNCAAVSRKTKIASLSSWSRWLRV